MRGRERYGSSLLVVLVAWPPSSPPPHTHSPTPRDCIARVQCYRLYPESEFEKLEKDPTPEVQRVSLTTTALRLLAMGVTDLPAFEFLQPPTVEALSRALEQLYSLGAMDAGGRLTDLGHSMASLPLDPFFSSLILRSEPLGCVADTVDVVAALSAENLFYTPREHREKARAARARYVSRHSLGPFLGALF